jgi:uncharacterized protein YjdB
MPLILVLIGLLTAGAGCQAPPELISITIGPQSPAIPAGLTQQLTATGRYHDGSSQDLTRLVVWSSSSPAVAAVASDGLATAIAPGQATLSAHLDGVTGTTVLLVTSARPTEITVDPAHLVLARGTSARLTATARYTDRSVRDVTDIATWTASGQDVAVADGQVRALGRGQAIVRATLDGITGSASVTVTSPSLLSIAVTPAAPSVARGIRLQLVATGTYSDHTTQELTSLVSWSSSDSAIAALSNEAGSRGQLSALRQGTVTVTAAFDGQRGTTSVRVTDATLTAIHITPAAPALAKGTTLQLAATGTYSDATTQDLTNLVTWSSSDSTIAALSGGAGPRGLLSALRQGVVSIEAAFDGRLGTSSVRVTDATLTAIHITPAAPALAKGTTLQLVATGTYSDSSAQDVTSLVTWSSSDSAVAAVSNVAGSRGRTEGRAPGAVTIEAAFAGRSSQTLLKVTDATLTALSVTPLSAALAKGTAQRFTATGTYSDSSTQDLTDLVTWSSSDSTVAAISNAPGSRGLATALGPGTATIRASLLLSGTLFSGAAPLTVTEARLLFVAVTPAGPVLPKGTVLQLVATGRYSDDSTQDLTSLVTWSSSDPAVATVSNAAGTRGLVTATGTGSTILMATLSGRSGTTALEVSSAVLTTLSLTPPSPSLPLGTAARLRATGIYSDGSTQDLTESATWLSSDTTIAAVSGAAGSRGLTTGISLGTTTVRATQGAVSGAATVTVTEAVLSALTVTPPDPTVPKGVRRQFVATGVYSDSSTHNLTSAVAWSSTDTTIAQISNAAGESGVALGLKEGTVTLKAAYLGKTAATTLTIVGAVLDAVAISPADTSIAKGTALQFIATGTYSDGSTQAMTDVVTWSSSDPAVATVSNAAGTRGLVNGAAAGMVTITASLGGKSAATRLRVTAAPLTGLSVSPAGAVVAKGATRRFVAIGTYSDGSTQDATSAVTWTSSNPAVAIISNAAGEQGQATGLGAGIVAISAALMGRTAATSLSVTLDRCAPTGRTVSGLACGGPTGDPSCVPNPRCDAEGGCTSAADCAVGYGCITGLPAGTGPGGRCAESIDSYPRSYYVVTTAGTGRWMRCVRWGSGALLDIPIVVGAFQMVPPGYHGCFAMEPTKVATGVEGTAYTIKGSYAFCDLQGMTPPGRGYSSDRFMGAGPWACRR